MGFALAADRDNHHAVSIGDYTLSVDALWPGADPFRGPLAFVDLARAPRPGFAIRLPACPVIGLGDPSHPLASMLDAVVEPPVSAEILLRAITARPLTAQIVTGLLRMLPHLPPDAGLVAESHAYGVLQASEEHARWFAGHSATPQAPGTVEVTRDAATLYLTLARAKAGNAIDCAMRDDLASLLAAAAVDDSLARIVLGAVGRCFSVGADLAEFGTTRDAAQACAIRAQTLPAHVLSRCADRLEVRVQGACIGAGLEMAAWARTVVATHDAWFQLPELAMGVLPGAGGCVSLVRRIGRQRTALLVLSGRRLSAVGALGWGLVDRIVDDFSADDDCTDIV